MENRFPKPEPQPGEVHLWTADLDLVVGREPFGGLSEDERARAAKFRSDSDRRRFAASRSVLRRLVGHYLGTKPEDVEFSYSAAGKPSVTGGLRFNVSHSENLFVGAFATGTDVGVDVETVRTDFVDDATVSFALNAGERAAMKASSDPVSYFFRCWTRKESLIKASGDGFSVEPSEIDSVHASGSPYTVVSLPLFPGAETALACGLPAPRIAVFRFPENLEAPPN